MVKNQNNRDRILSALPGTQSEIANKLSLAVTTVWRLINELVDDDRAHVYKREFGEYGGAIRSHYAAGPKPEGLTLKAPIPLNQVRVERYRLKSKQLSECKQKVKFDKVESISNIPIKLDILTEYFYGRTRPN